MKAKQLVIPIVLLFLFGFFAHDLLVDTASLTFVNDSTETIEELAVKVSSQEFVLGLLAPGDSKRIFIQGYSDSSWEISGQWKSGYRIHENVGYITHNRDFRDRVVFTPGRRLVYTSGQ